MREAKRNVDWFARVSAFRYCGQPYNAVERCRKWKKREIERCCQDVLRTMVGTPTFVSKCVETVCASVPVGCPEVTRLKSELSQAQDAVAKLQTSAGGHGPVMGMLL